MSFALFLLNLLFSPPVADPTPAPTPLVSASFQPAPLAALLPLSEPAPTSARTHKPKPKPRHRGYTVTATTYWPEPGQTDDNPMETADGSIIPTRHSSKTRWLAVSRDLLAPWGGPLQYGDKVRVSGISDALDGVYIIHDTMHRRHRHSVDVLVNEKECQNGLEGRWNNITLRKIPAPAPDWAAS